MQVARPILLGALAAAAAAALLIVIAIDGGRDAVFRSDADLFRRVALDPFGDGSAIDDPDRFGDAYRYGRILYPLAAWVLGAGQTTTTEVALGVIAALSVGAVVALAALHVRDAGGRAEDGLLVLVVPGLWLGTMATFSEPFVVALLLGGLLAEARGYRWRAAGVFAAMLLAREALIVALVPVAVRAVRRRGPVELVRLAAMVAPLALWWSWVRLRVGEWPPFDDSLSRREAVGLPVVSWFDLDRSAFPDASGDVMVAVAIAVGIATVVAAVAAVAAFRSQRGSLVAAAALATALVILFLGPNVWRFAGEALRTMTYPQVLLAVVLGQWRAARVPDATSPRGSAPPMPGRGR